MLLAGKSDTATAPSIPQPSPSLKQGLFISLAGLIIPCCPLSNDTLFVICSLLYAICLSLPLCHQSFPSQDNWFLLLFFCSIPDIFLTHWQLSVSSISCMFFFPVSSVFSSACHMSPSPLINCPNVCTYVLIQYFDGQPCYNLNPSLSRTSAVNSCYKVNVNPWR